VYFLECSCVLFEQVGVMVSNHRGTRSGWHHDELRVAEDVQKMARYLPGVSAVPCVEGRLSATCLILPEFDFPPGALQYVGHRKSKLGKELIDHARDEQGDPFAHGNLILASTGGAQWARGATQHLWTRCSRL